LELPNADPAILVDTVGFISQLPHELVAAFRSTLQETVQSVLLLHIIDAGAADRRDNQEEVERVLAEIGAAQLPRLRVFNKIDLLDQSPRLERGPDGRVESIWVSAARGDGLDLLRQAVAERTAAQPYHGWLHLPPSAARLRARLFELDAVLKECSEPDGAWTIEILTSRKNLDQLRYRDGLREEWLERTA
ncbi:MAG: GTPase HflX, partial [Candidatus Competibacteraceae bacterium]|nr:GTPase HflX [Candidatus Competibacteraceae bacterium]